MSKKISSAFKSVASLATLGASDALMGSSARSDMEKQAALQAQLLNRQALAAQNANQQPDVATILPGGSAETEDLRRKRRSVGGPVSTSLGINA